jgi:hypothetical protein
MTVLCKPTEQEDRRWICSECGFTANYDYKKVCSNGKEEEKDLLGDRIERALKKVGITKELMVRWMGGCGGCDRRQELLNDIDRWARKVLEGKTRGARKRLRKLLRRK